MSVEQYRQFQNTRMENQRLRAERQATAAREEVRRQAAAWAREARALKERYGDFDLLSELQSPAFQAMLRSGTPMQNAYEALHLSDIKAGVARKAGQAREKQVTDHIRARGGRPAEGASSGAGVTSRSKLSSGASRRSCAMMAPLQVSDRSVGYERSSGGSPKESSGDRWPRRWRR